MFAIGAAVLFAIALLLELVNRGTTFGVELLIIGGLLALSLHLAGFSSRIPSGGQWRSRGGWARRR
ncbi:hypothetical protein AB0L82_10740 [Nocardia sp. NPDC052001]|uniref:hypothetical protein n=1 Tax=unclassified Nocardia TaxID=2637762 RepID=UPI00341F9B8B